MTKIILSLYFLSAFAWAQDLSTAVPTDIILRNARVWTDATLNSDDRWVWKPALSIKKDSFYEINNRALVEKNKGPDTKIIDIGNRVVLPGFIDTNSNLIAGGLKKIGVEISSSVSDDDLKKAILEAQTEAIQNGITSVHTEIPNGLAEKTAKILTKLYDQHDLKIRISLWPDIEEFQKLDSLTSTLKNISEEFVKLAGFSIYVDGDLVQKKALLIEPYSDSPSPAAIQKYTQDQLNSYTYMCNKAKYSVAFHAAGDRAVGMVVNAVTSARKLLFNSRIRNRIIGLDVVHPAMFERLKPNHILAIAQPSHLLENGELQHPEQELIAHVGTTRAPYLFAYRSFLNRDIDLGIALDYPNYPMKPFNALYSAISRQPLVGKSPAHWNTAETLNVEQALRAFTYTGATASHDEHIKGSLREGKLADAIIVDNDPFTQKGLALTRVNVLMTIINGQIVYNRLP